MPTRNCETRPVTWKIHRNRQLAEAVELMAKYYDGDLRKGFFIWPMWIGFITHRDNLGFFDGAPGVLRDSFWPHHREINVEEVRAARDILHDRGLIIVYKVEGLEYVLVPKVSHWSRLIGNISTKTDFPLPDEEDIKAWERRMNDVYTPLKRCSNGDDTPYARRSNSVSPESKSKRESKKENNKDYEDRVKAFFDHPDPQWMAELKADYPSVDLSAEFKHMRNWLLADLGDQRKNLRRFAVNWLNNPKSKPASAAPAGFQVTEEFLHRELGKIATKDMIKNVLRKVPQKIWWKVEKYLKTRYPADPGRGYQEAEREVVEETRSTQSAIAGMTQELAGAKDARVQKAGR